MDDKIAIVTGGSSGIGIETVKGLLEKGYKVVIGCRRVTYAEEVIKKLENGNASVIYLDLTDMKSIEKFVDEFKEKFDHLDVLVNNSGVLVDDYKLSKEGFEIQFATNHLGHYALTGRLFDHLRKSKAARIVTVASMTHSRGKAFFKELEVVENRLDETEGLKDEFNRAMQENFSSVANYAKSKLANVLFTMQLARRLEQENIQNVTTYCLHPGVIRTNLFDQLNTGFIRLFYRASFVLLAVSAKQGAATSLHCALEEMQPEHNGWYFNNCRPDKKFSDIPEYIKAAETLWKLSEFFTNVYFNF